MKRNKSGEAYVLAAALEAGLQQKDGHYLQAALQRSNPRHARLLRAAHNLMKKYTFADVCAALELHRSELGRLPGELWEVEYVRHGKSWIERIVVVPPPPSDVNELYCWIKRYAARALLSGVLFDVPPPVEARLNHDRQVEDAIRNHRVHYRSRQFAGPRRVPTEIVSRWG